MDPEEFNKYLNAARELMIQEKYGEAIAILDKLKDNEQKNNDEFNYNLIHQLYQLDSNCISAYRQQIILEYLKNISSEKKLISFNELNQKLREKGSLNISDEILRREVELLILRNLIICKIEGNYLDFNFI
ncbi:MAG: hypothetical protein ACFFEN_04120 [Candidatus Thorarchaeota archaeon]